MSCPCGFGALYGKFQPQTPKRLHFPGQLIARAPMRVEERTERHEPGSKYK
jgi:hypothetical protein